MGSPLPYRASTDVQDDACQLGAEHSTPATQPSATSPRGLRHDYVAHTNDDFSRDMLCLGLEEPLPSQNIIDELTQIYFERIHPSLPMIHHPRFMAAIDLPPRMRPPVALRYAMWMHVCSITPKYQSLQETFYRRARKNAESDELVGYGEGIITPAHAQAWSLIAAFEFKMMFFPRAWMSCGRATRLCQMMGLHRLDGLGMDVKQVLLPPRDGTALEERRRTFWMAFCQDRYVSIGTGWPMIVDEQDIQTNLPMSEDAYYRGRPEKTLSLADVTKTGIVVADGAPALSSFAAVVTMACLFGRNITHLHRPSQADNEQDLNGEFWERHRALDSVLLNTSLNLPPHLRLPAGVADTNTIFYNMNLHASTICLHQAAVFKAEKHGLLGQIGTESKTRCIVAADQIASTMKTISHLDLSTMNPLIAFCLYVAARVFVQYIKSGEADARAKSSLLFLFSALQAMKENNPLTESFHVLLDTDLEDCGLFLPSYAARIQFGGKRSSVHHLPTSFDSMKCTPMFDLQESQKQAESGHISRGQRLQHDGDHTSNNAPDNFSRSQLDDAEITQDNARCLAAQAIATRISFDTVTGAKRTGHGSLDHRPGFGAVDQVLSEPFLTSTDLNSQAAYRFAPAAMVSNTHPAPLWRTHALHPLYSRRRLATSSQGSSQLQNSFSFLNSSDHVVDASPNPEIYWSNYNNANSIPELPADDPWVASVAIQDDRLRHRTPSDSEWMYQSWNELA